MAPTHTGIFCKIHPFTELICPRCQGKAGGEATKKKFGAEFLKKLGKKGGRPKSSKSG